MKKYYVYVTRVETYKVEAEDNEEAIDETLNGNAESIDENTLEITSQLIE